MINLSKKGRSIWISLYHQSLKLPSRIVFIHENPLLLSCEDYSAWYCK